VTELDRRAFLRWGATWVGGALLFGAAGPGLLEGCRAHHSAAPPTDLGTLTLNLAWVPDVESGGEFVARDKGYYADEGFNAVRFLPGGPTAAPPQAALLAGSTLLAVSSLDPTAAAIQGGAALRVIGCQYPINPSCIMSLASRPLNTPRDLVGKKIGVQAANSAVWMAFLQANHLKPSQVDTVGAGFDPTPLTNGTVDGWFSQVTREPIALGVAGVETHTFLLGDYGYPEVGNVYVVTTAALRGDRTRVTSALTAEITAWRECISHPNEPAQATVRDYPGSQTLALAQQQSLAQNALLASGSALTHGLFYVPPAVQASNVHTLAVGGLKVSSAQLFDMSLLDEIYGARPDLKPVPAQGTI
jgi:ABC-type nitrate/sulfonate/bicarbonate transport system substrate-binding protein